MTNEGIHWYALTVTPEENLDNALANLKSILASLSATTTPGSTSVSAYELLDTDPKSADATVTAKTVEKAQVQREIDAKTATLTEKKGKTKEKQTALTTAQAKNDIAKIQTAYAELAAAMADEASVNNEINELKSKQARLEQDIDEAQCGRANNQYKRINAICSSISNTKKSLQEDVETLKKEIEDLKTKKKTTLYQDPNEIEKEKKAKEAAKTAKETAITKLDNLLKGYQETLTKATTAREQEFAVMQQSSLVSLYTDKIAQAQAALEAYKSQIASYNETITKLNNENKKTKDYKPKDLINLDTDQGYKDATKTVGDFTTLKTGAETERGNARTSATYRKNFNTLETAIAKAEGEYIKEVDKILNPKQS